MSWPDRESLGIVSEPFKIRMILWPTQSKKIWKFDWISSGRSTDAKPAPYLIRAVPVEVYTSRKMMAVDKTIESHCIKWMLNFDLLEPLKNERFIQTIGFIDSHMITITESYFLTKITLLLRYRFSSFVNHLRYQVP